MKVRWFLAAILLLLIFPSNVSGQFGVRLKYDLNQYNNWSNALREGFSTTETLYPSSYGIGVNHWFRLKKKRVEFLPEIGYARSETQFENPSIEKFTINTFSFNFHTQIYALDMGEDCDCPTFSKQGNTINKGLFFHITPGIAYIDAKGFPNPILSSLPLPNGINRGLAASIGAGLGLDIGINDLLTITPIASYYFYSKMTWDNMVQRTNEVITVDNNLRHTQFSLRFSFRLDYNKRQKRFRR